MPVTIDNGLPTITLDLSLCNGGPKLQALLDTCGAMNTGWLQFHLYIITTYPHLVTEFNQFDDSNPFKPVKLHSAIVDPDTFDTSKHGILTVLVRYYTPIKTMMVILSSFPLLSVPMSRSTRSLDSLPLMPSNSPSTLPLTKHTHTLSFHQNRSPFFVRVPDEVSRRMSPSSLRILFDHHLAVRIRPVWTHLHLLPMTTRMATSSAL